MTTVRKRAKFKVGRRLGPAVYEKCQTDKFMLAEARKQRAPTARRRRSMSEYNLQLMEKQKVRFTYGIGERQFRNYVREAIAVRGVDTTKRLYEILESRLDNVTYRAGLAPTRAAARQLVSHGHITVNGKRILVPSHRVVVKDRIAVREGSRAKPFFDIRREDMEKHITPMWLTYDHKKHEGEITAAPLFDAMIVPFDLALVLEFYSR
ncbi:30S ribosomal protein S4 [Candidatus Wolfebacteria bacterium]|nr:30S ribosomal protein S4 [Candidatus Wolfebacteria bacterium]